jgi:glucan phosphoethanolaminetransferase (alkaline phosphatase superfamily)
MPSLMKRLRYVLLLFLTTLVDVKFAPRMNNLMTLFVVLYSTGSIYSRQFYNGIGLAQYDCYASFAAS